MKSRLFRRIAVVIIILFTSVSATYAKGGARDTLRILAIGNSFSDDGTDQIPALLANMEVKNVEIARLYRGGCSLEQHVNFYNNAEAAYVFYHSPAGVNEWTATKNYTLKAALEMQQWDIITLQQVSGWSGIYDTYLAHLPQLIDIVRSYQPNARLVWHMTWSYASTSGHGDFPKYNKSSEGMYNAICDCVAKMRKDFPQITGVIPSGYAVQLLRKSPINIEGKDMCRDGFHIDYGAGRYTLALVWYETLIKPFTHKSMKKNTLRVDKGLVPVTDDATAKVCIDAARKATKAGKKM